MGALNENNRLISRISLNLALTVALARCGWDYAIARHSQSLSVLFATVDVQEGAAVASIGVRRRNKHSCKHPIDGLAGKVSVPTATR